MTLDLTKKTLETGENVALVLDKGQTLTKIKLGLGWDIRSGNGSDFDLDAIVTLLGENGKVHASTSDSICYFNNKKVLGDVVVHSGDNRTGEGKGDDETIVIDLQKMPATVKRVLASVVIYQAQERSQNFGQVQNAYARVYADGSKFVVDDKEVAEIRYDLTEDYSASTSIEVVEIYRHNDSWKVKGLGKGYKESVKAHLERFI